MIVECSSEGVQLTEPLDFLRFKLGLRGDASFEARSWQGITFLDDHTARVSIDLVLALRVVPVTRLGHRLCRDSREGSQAWFGSTQKRMPSARTSSVSPDSAI